MKYSTIIMQTITASALILGMAAQATAAESNQAGFDTSSSTHGPFLYISNDSDNVAENAA